MLRLLVLAFVLNCMNKLEIKDKNTEIIELTEKNDYKELEKLLNNGINLNYKNSEGKTALMVAATKGYVEILILLLEKGAEIDLLDNKNEGALYYSHDINILNALINYGANVNINRRGIYNILNKMIFQGESEEETVSGSCYQDHLNTIEKYKIILLKNIEKGIDLNTKDFEDDKTLLMWIYLCLGRDISKNLLSNNKININIKDKLDKTILIYAIENNDLEFVNFLLEKGADVNLKKRNISPMLIASYKCNVQILKSLLSKGAKINIKYDREYVSDIHSFSKEVIQELLNYKLDVNEKDILNNTILNFATNLDLDAFKLIVSKSKDVNAKNIYGINSLIIIISDCYFEKLEKIKFLLDNRADIETKNKCNSTPLLLASENMHQGDIIENMNIVKMLIEKGADVNAKNINLETSLILICKSFFYDLEIDIIKMLIEKGANVNDIDIHSKTPLMYLLQEFQRGYINEEIINAIKVLIDNGAKIPSNALEYTIKRNNENNPLIDELKSSIESNLNKDKYISRLNPENINTNLDLNLAIRTKNVTSVVDFIINNHLKDLKLDDELILNLIFKTEDKIFIKSILEGYKNLFYDPHSYLDNNLEYNFIKKVILKGYVDKNFIMSIENIERRLMFIKNYIECFIINKDYDILKYLVDNNRYSFSCTVSNIVRNQENPNQNLYSNLMNFLLNYYGNLKNDYFINKGYDTGSKYSFLPFKLYEFNMNNLNYLKSLSTHQELSMNLKTSCVIEAFYKDHIKFIESALNNSLIVCFKNFRIQNKYNFKKVLVEQTHDEDIFSKDIFSRIKYQFYSLSGNCYKDVLVSIGESKANLKIIDMKHKTPFHVRREHRDLFPLEGEIENLIDYKDVGYSGEFENILFEIGENLRRGKGCKKSQLIYARKTLNLLKEFYYRKEIKKKSDLYNDLLLLYDDLLVEVMIKLK